MAAAAAAKHCKMIWSLNYHASSGRKTKQNNEEPEIWLKILFLYAPMVFFVVNLMNHKFTVNFVKTRIVK